MTLVNFKYVLLICIAITLFLKTGNVISYIKYAAQTEYASLNGDATEKEEKKVESEYVWQQFTFQNELKFFVQPSKKISIPDHFFQLAYFPEVLTPPPSA